MGKPELEAVLRRDGENKAREIWQSVEEKASQVRRETETELEQLAEEGRVRSEQKSALVTEKVMNTARQQVRLSRLEAEQRLAERLLALAKGMLPQLAEQGGKRLFQQLADEIPTAEWRLVKVNDRDIAMAKDRFPNAEVLVSDAICGGLVVEDTLAEIIIINTLEKRLEHLWPQLLPDLLMQLRLRVKNDATAAGT